jgi:hypothetical protein
VIVASLVEQRRDATMRVSGPLERDRGGLRIGGLRLSGLDAALVGRRVQAEGRVERGVMQVSRTAVDDLSGFAGARHLSIEGYVRRTGGNLRFGSGYVMHDDGRSGSSGAGRVVVNATFDGSGGLRVDKIQPVKAFPGQTNQGGRTELTPGTTLDPAGSNVSAGNSGGGPAGTGPPGLRGGGPPGLGGVLPGVGNTVRGLVGGGPPGLGGGGSPGLVGGALRGVGGVLHGGGKH